MKKTLFGLFLCICLILCSCGAGNATGGGSSKTSGSSSGAGSSTRPSSSSKTLDKAIQDNYPYLSTQDMEDFGIDTSDVGANYADAFVLGSLLCLKNFFEQKMGSSDIMGCDISLAQTFDSSFDEGTTYGGTFQYGGNKYIFVCGTHTGSISGGLAIGGGMSGSMHVSYYGARAVIRNESNDSSSEILISLSRTGQSTLFKGNGQTQLSNWTDGMFFIG